MRLARRRRCGRLSRLAGRGGGTTLPGKLLATIDPGALSTLAARLPQGSALVSATNGKTTTAALVAAILSPRVRLAHNGAGANLVSGRRLGAARGARCGARPVRGRRGRASRGRAARPAARGLPRATSSATSSTATASSSSSPSAGGRPSRRSRPTSRLVVNADDPLVGDLARERPGSVTFGVDDPSQARPSLQHAADSKYCLRCGTPYDYAAAYVGHLGDYRCPALRPRAAAARRRRPRDRAARARGGVVRPRHAGGDAARADRAARALQRLQRARRGGARARAGRLAGRDRGRARRPRGPRSAASSGSTSATGACCCC